MPDTIPARRRSRYGTGYLFRLRTRRERPSSGLSGLRWTDGAGQRQSIVRPVQTIEHTGKQWKLMQLYGALLLMVAIAGVFWSFTGSSVALLVTILSFAGGFTLVVLGRVGAWWYHR